MMRIAHIVPSLEERHGGPSKSVRALANHLVDADHQVDLLATDEHAADFPPDVSGRARLQVLPRVAPRWLSRSPQLRAHLLKTPYDCIHNHALWLLPLRYAAEAARRHDAPLVISPRGMMSGWAWQHRRLRKRFADLFVHPDALRQAAGWHATSTGEADAIHALGFSQPVCVSPNGVALPEPSDLATARTVWHDLVPAARSRPVALFYSRLHRKKRVRELIDLWLSLPRGDWLLLVVGVAEDWSAAGLAAEVAARDGADRVVVMDGQGRPAPYAAASLFVLPSHSENFGLVIAEALAAGLPALVTDTTPWTGLTSQGAGWCVPWENYRTVLTAVLTASPTELAAMGRRGRDWVVRDFSWNRAAALLQGFYASLRHARD